MKMKPVVAQGLKARQETFEIAFALTLGSQVPSAYPAKCDIM